MTYYKGMYLSEPGTLVVTVSWLTRNWRDWIVLKLHLERGRPIYGLGEGIHHVVVDRELGCGGWLRIGPLNINWRKS